LGSKKTITKLIQQGLSQDQINNVMQQIKSHKPEDGLEDFQMSFKDDHSVSASVSASGGLQTGSFGIAGTWVLNGNKLTMTFQGVGSDQGESSDTSEIVSLSKSQLVLRSHGATFTYISSK